MIHWQVYRPRSLAPAYIIEYTTPLTNSIRANVAVYDIYAYFTTLATQSEPEP